MISSTGVREVYSDELTWLGCGDSKYSQHKGVDLVLTNPYGSIPGNLIGVPLLVCGFPDYHHLCETYTGAKLYPLSEWAGGRALFWYGNTEYRDVSISHMQAEPEGWFPKSLTDELLSVYPSTCVWDGFMGRGTTGLSCRQKGIKFIGIDKNPDRVKMAKRYILEYR